MGLGLGLGLGLGVGLGLGLGLGLGFGFGFGFGFGLGFGFGFGMGWVGLGWVGLGWVATIGSHFWDSPPLLPFITGEPNPYKLGNRDPWEWGTTLGTLTPRSSRSMTS